MKVGCFHCDARMPAGLSFCPRCGQPTPVASYEERQEWEVRQWRGTHPTVTTRVHATTVTVPRRLETIVEDVPPARPVRPGFTSVEFPQIGALRPTAPPEPVVRAPEVDQLTQIVELLTQMSGRIDALAGRLEEMQPRTLRDRLRRREAGTRPGRGA